MSRSLPCSCRCSPLIFVFQATLARSRRAHRLVRNGFLLVVLVWLGWTAGVQLSIVNVMNYLMAPFNHFDIGFYLAEPLMVIIAGYTLVSVLLIGRGVFCGWLCPFGALQELLGQLSRALACRNGTRRLRWRSACGWASISRPRSCWCW